MFNHFKKAICVYTLTIVLGFFFLPGSLALAEPQSGPSFPKYVFLFLSDGGGMAHLEIARQYRKQVLNEDFVIVDKIIKEGSVGVITTHPANSLSTDSARCSHRAFGRLQSQYGVPSVSAPTVR